MPDAFSKSHFQMLFFCFSPLPRARSAPPPPLGAPWGAVRPEGSRVGRRPSVAVWDIFEQLQVYRMQCACTHVTPLPSGRLPRPWAHSPPSEVSAVQHPDHGPCAAPRPRPQPVRDAPTTARVQHPDPDHGPCVVPRPQLVCNTPTMARAWHPNHGPCAAPRPRPRPVHH